MEPRALCLAGAASSSACWDSFIVKESRPWPLAHELPYALTLLLVTVRGGRVGVGKGWLAIDDLPDIYHSPLERSAWAQPGVGPTFKNFLKTVGYRFWIGLSGFSSFNVVNSGFLAVAIFRYMMFSLRTWTSLCYNMRTCLSPENSIKSFVASCRVLWFMHTKLPCVISFLATSSLVASPCITYTRIMHTGPGPYKIITLQVN